MVIGPGTGGWWRGGAGVVEWDAESDLDVPAGDADFVDDEAQQFLALIEVEAVEGCGGSFGEGADALTKPVVLGQLVALVGEGLALVVDAGASGVEFSGSALHLDELDEPGLVEVDEPVAFGEGGVGPAVEAGQLGGEQFIVGCRGAGGDGVFAGEEHVGAQQRVADLVEDEGVELVGANVPFGAAAVLAAGT